MLASLTNQPVLFGLLGGLGLLLFGVKLVSEGVNKAADARLRPLLHTLTANRLLGLLAGTGVTTLTQSSTVTMIMLVGFVNAGLISLVQAIVVALGTNLGTTITIQLIAFPVWHLALPLIALGVAVQLFGREWQVKNLGDVVLGVGLVFLALTLLGGTVGPLSDTLSVRELLAGVGANPLLGVAIGAALTVLLQSGCATVGLVMALAGSGLVNFETAAAVIAGEGLGVTLTVSLTAVGTSLAARRTALAHLIFTVAGISLILLCFPWLIASVEALTPGSPDLVIHSAEQLELYGGTLGGKPFIARHIANAHTLFSLLNALLFFPLVGQLARLTALLLPGKDAAPAFRLNYLDRRVMNTPPIALAQARAELDRMAQLTGEVVDETVTLLRDQKVARLESICRKEELVDRLQREISDFLVALTQQSVTAETSREVAALIHTVDDLERISDHCVNLGRLVERKIEQQIEFSEIARRELAEMSALTVQFYAVVSGALGGGPQVPVGEAERLEDAIDRMEEGLRNNHVYRLNTGECTVNSGLIFIDMLHHLEKIGDHTFKIARSMATGP